MHKRGHLWRRLSHVGATLAGMDLPASSETYRSYRAHERPDVLVTLDDGDEVEGELRAWKRVDGAWVGSVQWRRGPGQCTRTGDFPANRVREDDRDLAPPGWSGAADSSTAPVQYGEADPGCPPPKTCQKGPI